MSYMNLMNEIVTEGPGYYTRRIFCPTCHSMSATGVRACRTCDGKGWIEGLIKTPKGLEAGVQYAPREDDHG